MEDARGRLFAIGLNRVETQWEISFHIRRFIHISSFFSHLPTQTLYFNSQHVILYLKDKKADQNWKILLHYILINFTFFCIFIIYKIFVYN